MGKEAATIPDFEGYRVVRELGRGGMGAVLLAEHQGTGLRYAIKMLHAHLADDEGLRDRFRLEADALQSLRDPNVVLVHDSGVTALGTPWIVMELLQGRSLTEEMRERGPLPITESLSFAIQMLDGLAASHRAGILHRDVKPDNLFLCDGPEPRTLKVTDFGIAKVYLDRLGGARPLSAPTAEGLTVGTPRWCSPEAFLGDSTLLSPASDLYSVGLILHAMVSGRLPWSEHRSMEAPCVRIVAASL